MSRRPGRSASGLVLLAALLVAAAALSWLALEPAGPATAQDRMRAVAASLRCPVCQDLSVADSPSPLAGQIRQEIADRLRAGETPDEIRAFFVERYGAWILLSPPKSGITLLAWLLPLALLLGGVAAAVFAVRRWTRDAPDANLSATGDRLSPADRSLLGRALEGFPGLDEPGAEPQ